MNKLLMKLLMKPLIVLSLVLVAGFILGTYLPDFWKGFGGENTIDVRIGDPTSSSEKELMESPATQLNQTALTTPVNVPPVLKVVIDEGAYIIRSTAGDRPVKISEVVALVKAATGDADGIRVRVYRKKASRMAEGHALQDAFVAAGISESAVVWAPTAID